MAKDMEAPLRTIIEVLNDKFGTTFTPTDQLLVEQVIAHGKSDRDTVDRARVNSFDNFEPAMGPKVESFMIDRMEKNEEIVARCFRDDAFRSVMVKEIARRIYDDVRKSSSRPPASG